MLETIKPKKFKERENILETVETKVEERIDILKTKPKKSRKSEDKVKTIEPKQPKKSRKSEGKVETIKPKQSKKRKHFDEVEEWTPTIPIKRKRE